MSPRSWRARSPKSAAPRRGRFNWRRLLFGSPLKTERALHERLPIVLALPVFASDALSSVAYATETILRQFQSLHVAQASGGRLCPSASPSSR